MSAPKTQPTVTISWTNPLLQLVLARGTQSTNDMSISIEPEGYAAQDITPAQ